MQGYTNYGTIPIRPEILAESMSEYASPKDRISTLTKQGELIRLKKGLYVVAPQVTQTTLNLEVIANQLYGPSYVSYESALSYHGLIPERVHTIRSASFHRGKSYQTPLGRFEYKKVPENYFSIGLQQVITESYAFIIASPEKALCDLITGTAGLRIQSVKAMRTYLQDDLRIDTSETEWNLSILESCLEQSAKKSTLRQLYQFLQYE